jgi:hypothetical protein
MDRCIKPQVIRLSKIEAARLQIESAIWLWFVGNDIVSIQTLANAAHRILRDVAQLWGSSAWPTTAAYFPAAAEGFDDSDARSEDASTYFRHVKENETYEVSKQWTELNLFDAVMAYGNLADDRSGSALMSTFVIRFAVERQDLFITDAFSMLERRVSTAFNASRLESLSRMDFLKEFLGFLGPVG